MDTVAILADEARADLFRETGARFSLPPSLVEKDFWVCWTLHRLFDISRAWPRIVFKGGTSLSKGYGAIKRFSEDIDLSINRHDFGFDDSKDPITVGLSKKVRDRLKEELRNRCASYVEHEVLPGLRADFESTLDQSSVWSLELDTTIEKQIGIKFRYPRQFQTHDYVPPFVLLEFGATSDHDGARPLPITPYSAEAFPAEFTAPIVRVPTYDCVRTFWEKATILHYHHHVNDPTKLVRQSRHYYDLAMLARGEVGESALDRLDVLRAVVQHKIVFFTKTAARYDEAGPGTLRLVPQSNLLSPLREDYRSMTDMLYGDPPTFDEMLTALRELEARINAS